MIVKQFSSFLAPPSDVFSSFFSLHGVDIWMIDLAGEYAFDQLYQVLDGDERKRCDKLYSSHHKLRFTISHALTRAILAEYLQTEPADLVWGYNAHKKPCIDSCSGLVFNLSHSSDIALLAVSQQSQVGVDIEHYSQKQRDFRRIAKRYFHRQEIIELEMLDCLEDVRQYFYQLWTQKEAVIKALGLGLHFPLGEIGLFESTKSFLPLPCSPFSNRTNGKNWYVFSGLLKTGYIFSLVSDFNQKNIRLLDWQSAGYKV